MLYQFILSILNFERPTHHGGHGIQQAGPPTVRDNCCSWSWWTFDTAFVQCVHFPGWQPDSEHPQAPLSEGHAGRWPLGPANKQTHSCETDSAVGHVKNQAHGDTHLWDSWLGWHPASGDSRAEFPAWLRAWPGGGVQGTAGVSLEQPRGGGWAFLQAPWLLSPAPWLSRRHWEPSQLTEHLACPSPGCHVWLRFRSHGGGLTPTISWTQEGLGVGIRAALLIPSALQPQTLKGS